MNRVSAGRRSTVNDVLSTSSPVVWSLSRPAFAGYAREAMRGLSGFGIGLAYGVLN